MFSENGNFMPLAHRRLICGFSVFISSFGLRGIFFRIIRLVKFVEIRDAIGGFQFWIYREEKRDGNKKNQNGGKNPTAFVKNFAHCRGGAKIKLKEKLYIFHKFKGKIKVEEIIIPISSVIFTVKICQDFFLACFRLKLFYKSFWDFLNIKI